MTYAAAAPWSRSSWCAAAATRRRLPDLAGKLMAACHQDGLVLLKAGTYDNVIRIMPPLVINDALLDEGLSIIEKAFASL